MGQLARRCAVPALTSQRPPFRLLSAGHSPTGSALSLYGALVGAITPLYAAALGCHSEAASALLAAGAPPELGLSSGPFGLLEAETPLSVAIEAGCSDLVSSLLAAGASPQRGESLGPLGTLASGTPQAMVSVASDDEATIAELLKMGASPNDGFSFLLGWAFETPLSLAAGRGHQRVVAHLLQAGANPDMGQSFAFGASKATPLAMAAKNGHSRICAALLRAGADVHKAGGARLLHMVRERGGMRPEAESFKEVARLLEELL